MKINFFTFLFFTLMFNSMIYTNAVIKLDEQSKELLDEYNKIFDTIKFSLDDNRPCYYWPKEFKHFKSEAEIEKVENIDIGGPFLKIPLRIYIPCGKEEFPVFVAFHGGHWIGGDLDSFDSFCKEICNQAQCIVVSVDYNKPWKYKFPWPVNQSYFALDWVCDNISRYGGNLNKIAIGGEDSGGTMAAAVALMARDNQEISLTAQVLIYPAITKDFTTKSYQLYNDGYRTTTRLMQASWSLFLHCDDDIKNAYACPSSALSFKDLPQTLMIIAAFDPLRDDGLMYAKKLKKDNVAVEQLIYPTFHDFIEFNLDISKKTISDIAQYLQKIFN